MEYPKYIISNQKEESISIQRVKGLAINSSVVCIGKTFPSERKILN